jgi:hypothetical protein
MKKQIQSERSVLRQKAEEQLKKKLSKPETKLSDAEMLKLIHELEVHQVELEMQNEELILAKEQATLASEKYIELYDFAPSGYFTLSPKGEIIQLNLAGAEMLGKARSQLKNRLFHVFVANNSQPFFLHFLEKVFSGHKKEICELALSINTDKPVYVHITGISSENSGNCLVTAIDITQRKLAEEDLAKKDALLNITGHTAKVGGWEFDVKTMRQTWTDEVYAIHEVDKTFNPNVENGIGFYAPWSKPIIENAVSEAVELGKAFCLELEFITGKGHHLWVRSIGEAMQVNGKTTKVYGSFQNITDRKQAEEELRTSNEFNRLLLQTIPLGMDIVDEDGNILFMSDGLKLHFNAVDMDKKCWELYRDDKKQCQECPLRTDIKIGETRVNEAHGVFGGKIFEVSHTGMLYNGKKALLEIFIDITSRKQVETLLQISEEKYHAIFNNIQDVFYQTDLSGTVLEVSPSIENFLGFTRDEIIGKPLAKLSFDFKSRDMFFYKLKENGELRDYELRLKTKTAEFKYTSINARLVFDADGKPNHIDGAIRDITERKLAEVELRASKDYLHNIINAVASPIFVKDVNHKFVLVNNALCSLLKIPMKEIIGTTGYDYLPEEQMKVFIAKDKEVFKTGKVNINEEYLTDGTGNIRTIVTRKSLYTDTGGNKFLVGVINDITERKLAEKQIIRLNRVYSVLSNINQTIVRNHNKELLFDEVCRITVDDGGFMMAWIGMVNPTTNKIDVVASSGKAGDFLNSINIDLNNTILSSGPAGQAFKSGKSSFSNNIESDDRTYYWRKIAHEYGYRSVIALPLILWGKTIGVYMIYSGEIDFFNEDEIKLLDELASDISFALEFIDSEKKRSQTELELQSSELKYHNIFNNVQDVFYQTNIAGTVLDVSPSIGNISGFNRDEIIGKPVTNLYFDPNDRVKILELLKKNGELRDYELCLKNKTGKLIYTSINARLIFDADGKPNHIDGAIRDITDRKRVQEKLTKSEERFKLAMLASNDGLFDWNLETNEIYYSPGWKKIIGYEDHELPNDFSVWEEATDPLSVSKSWDLHQKLISKKIDRFMLEFKMKHKDGHWVDILSQAKAIFNEAGKAVRIVGTQTDISERKRTEGSLVKLKTAIEKSEVSVVITDRNGNIEYANPYFTELTGYTPNEYLGKNPRVLKSAFHTKEFYKDMWNTIISGKTWEGEFYNCKKNGEMYWENAIISPVENNNKEITHFVAIKTDITNAKNINSELIIAKEHAEESDRLKSAFLANMSHEIRTPMNGILGFTELLKEPDLSGDQQKYYIGIIEKSGARLLNIINNIIDISKIESGLMKVKNSEINVNEYLDQILTFFNPEANAKNIKLICNPGLPTDEAFLKTDSEKFYAILINLVKNALKYTETGIVEFGYIGVVETQCIASLHETSLPNHSYLQFFVKDTGIGIPKDRQEAIFERFIQADIVDKMARQGAGLGLAISKAYVEMLKGKIWVESEEENLPAGKKGGSTFYFTLPIRTKPKSKRNDKIEILNSVKEVQVNSEVSGLKILIAEDDELSSEFISIGVRKIANDTINVQTGRGAVEACRNNPDIDLILMDIQMPEMNGYDATRQIRQFNTEVKIIAVTAFALAGDREKSIEAGCSDYISKPIKKDELLEMIQKYFKR